jgi:hypothetical protein
MPRKEAGGLDAGGRRNPIVWARTVGFHAVQDTAKTVNGMRTAGSCVRERRTPVFRIEIAIMVLIFSIC